MLRYRCGHWTVLCVPGAKPLADELAALPSIPASCTQVLRDDRHSFVGLLPLAGLTLVVKQQRSKDGRPWIRLTTLLRQGHAFRALRTLHPLREAGIAMPRPLLALEQRSRGMVRESWFVYEYVPGTTCGEDAYGLIVQALQRLHALGWLHGDPHWRNFLTDGNSVYLLDANPVRKRCGLISECYDFILLSNSRPGFAAHLPATPGQAAWRIARAYDTGIHAWRGFKARVRRLLGYRRP